MPSMSGKCVSSITTSAVFALSSCNPSWPVVLSRISMFSATDIFWNPSATDASPSMNRRIVLATTWGKSVERNSPFVDRFMVLSLSSGHSRLPYRPSGSGRFTHNP